MQVTAHFRRFSMSAEMPSPIHPQPSWWHISIGEVFGRVADWFHLAFRSDDKKIEWIMDRFRASQSSPSRHNDVWALRHLTSIEQNISKKRREEHSLTKDQEQTLAKVQGVIQKNFQPQVSTPRGGDASPFSQRGGGMDRPRAIMPGVEGSSHKEDSRAVTEAVEKIVASSSRLKGEDLVFHFRDSIEKVSVSSDAERQRIIALLLQRAGVQRRLDDSMDGFLGSLVIQLFARTAPIEELKQRYDAMREAIRVLSPQLAEDFERNLGKKIENAIDQTTHLKIKWQSPKEFKKVHGEFILLKELGEKWPVFQRAIDVKAERWLLANKVHVGKMVAKIKLSDAGLQGEYVEILNKFPQAICSAVLAQVYSS
jgi:hypothetical protein